MGSDSDWPTVQEAGKALDGLEVPWEAHVMSAHRTPDAVREFAESAQRGGIGVIIAAAGGAAHLAGVVAAHTTLPVIGIPIQTSSLGGLDSLLSTVQMPGGIPVATMGIGNAGARNAGLFAAAVLALGDDALAERVERFRREQAQQVQEKNARLQGKLKGEH
jgi:phosphoribosylaminoimidazole carboxylase PurE protein